MVIHFIIGQTERGQFIRNYKIVKLFQLSFSFFLNICIKKYKEQKVTYM